MLRKHFIKLSVYRRLYSDIQTSYLKPARVQDCDKGDYEFWTPLTPTGGCLLGKRLSLKRRKPEAHCFNGVDHERGEDHMTECDCGSVRFSDHWTKSRVSLEVDVLIIHEHGLGWPAGQADLPMFTVKNATSLI